ncbi:MAG: hypothetical protein AAFZ65_19470 [Planctomycetota bacterium]
MSRRLRSRHGALVLATLVAGLAACGAGSEGEVTLEPLPERDLAMLELMLRINPPYLGMQSELRNPAAMVDVAAAAEVILDACEDEAFVGWVERPDFERDPATWRASYADLLEGARTARDAARAGELDRLHEAYTRMSKSCTACHKRYSPHQ